MKGEGEIHAGNLLLRIEIHRLSHNSPAINIRMDVMPDVQDTFRVNLLDEFQCQIRSLRLHVLRNMVDLFFEADSAANFRKPRKNCTGGRNPGSANGLPAGQRNAASARRNPRRPDLWSHIAQMAPGPSPAVEFA